ncbi:DUF3298 domain-containing protein [Virgibacillus dakarensis]|uniref:DUF3298 domain-containing protein n=1 Tax=Lentibacillus populi TaxID=1827502 RepID=A0A9W5X6G7_9BACI|nr:MULTISPECIES: DUF3298 and DUF4163 domain-containing protein [Bacillaceae]MBT2217018.1 DUF3298 domain-containing protein [Virgibacillus dakarensis]MTW86917.1 DUF3298 domain-containing protein [Virgibacillus dakarensis]GGB52482.1 hypothetical protein GCM10011409_32550 [Lentibacillus populi]
MANQPLPVSIRTMLYQQQGTTIHYPQLFGLQNPEVQQQINQEIVQQVQTLINLQYQKQGADSFTEMIGNYEIKTNERNVLSLSSTNYAIAYHYAHGLTIMKSLTFDTQTGKNFNLKDLFKPGSDYVDVLSEIVQKQIQERNLDLLDTFKGIEPDQDYYIADKALVLYFQPYEITPYYVGFPMFPISVYSIQDIINENGPLGQMAGNQ